MNWVVFAFVTWVLVGVETGFRDAMAINLTSGAIAPSFLLCLTAYIALGATPTSARWSALIIGVLADLAFDLPMRDAGPQAFLIGPYALAHLLAAQLVLTLRGIMIRRNPLTLGFASMCAAGCANLLIVALLSIRKGIYGDALAMSPWTELVLRMGSSVYTGLVAVGLSLVLLPLAPMMGLNMTQKRFGRGS
jgi:hypothetical protein